MEPIISVALLIGLLVLWYRGAAMIGWLAVLALLVWSVWHPSWWFWMLYLMMNALLLYEPWRIRWLSDPLVGMIRKKKLMPKISDTEKIALRAGTVWVDGELFSGKPDFKWIFSQSYPQLSGEEAAFLENEVDRVCAMTDDDRVFKTRDLSPEVWEYLKTNRFFGMIIPKDYGGLGFSALGHSAVIQKLASRSQVLAITAMVPNSIGPAELLLNHGTPEQKEYYLPRLADGREIPCFALTEPFAGSDATSIRSEGTLFKMESGELKITLEFEKRYITLGAIATVIGLAFVLRDPEHLLGGSEDLGITFALVPSGTEGVVQGRRHDPLGMPFINSPISGSGVVISLDAVVGGEAGIGEGWKMLMESLSVGRGISLPSTGCGGIKLTARVAGAYTMIREQFGMPVAGFEGVNNELARIALTSYMMDAARIFTIGAIDAGEKPAVINAVMKYHATEKFRDVINSGMDVLGGAGIILGPRNLLGRVYMSAPIGITVEGANIMTRTLIQFGQGVIRCHPYAFEEMEALRQGHIEDFDRNFWSHVGFTLRNAFRMTLLSLTRGHIHCQQSSGIMARYERKLAWSSATFAFMTDFVMAYYGGRFKQKEMLSARLGDILSWMYLLIAAMRRFKAEGERKEDEVYLHAVGELALYEIECAYDGIFSNIGSGALNWFFRHTIRYYGRLNPIGQAPSDGLYAKIAADITAAGEQRERLTAGIYLPQESGQSLQRIESVLRELEAVKPLKTKLKETVRSGLLHKSPAAELYDEALKKEVISQEEYARLQKVLEETEAVVQVDAYSIDDYLGHR